MSLTVVRAKGHRHPCGDRMEYDGRITFTEMPDVIEVEGTLYQKVEKPAGYVNPEMHQVRETR